MERDEYHLAAQCDSKSITLHWLRAQHILGFTKELGLQMQGFGLCNTGNVARQMRCSQREWVFKFITWIRYRRVVEDEAAERDRSQLPSIATSSPQSQGHLGHSMTNT